MQRRLLLPVLLVLLAKRIKSFHIAPDCASALSAGRVHRERHFCSPALVSALRRDLRELAPQFQPSTSFSSDGSQDNLRSALTCRPNVESDAFDVLYEQLEATRQQLEVMLGRELSSGIEATYVIYPPTSGHYKRHIDSIQGVDESGSGRRAVSFICYLPDPDVPWTPSDGGQLRIYGEGAEYDDILPTSGSLVLFDSKWVWHEVMPTFRERACLVGWFREVA